VIAVTAMARVEDRERILSAGCNEYVSKPYVVDELEVLLRRYLSC
jgi:CheY-like chemotaxis protein